MDTSAGVPAVCNREGSNPRTTNAGGERWRRHGNGLQQQHQSRSIHCRGLPPLRRPCHPCELVGLRSGVSIMVAMAALGSIVSSQRMSMSQNPMSSCIALKCT